MGSAGWGGEREGRGDSGFSTFRNAPPGLRTDGWVTGCCHRAVPAAPGRCPRRPWMDVPADLVGLAPLFLAGCWGVGIGAHFCIISPSGLFRHKAASVTSGCCSLASHFPTGSRFGGKRGDYYLPHKFP